MVWFVRVFVCLFVCRLTDLLLGCLIVRSFFSFNPLFVFVIFVHLSICLFRFSDRSFTCLAALFSTERVTLLRPPLPHETRPCRIAVSRKLNILELCISQVKSFVLAFVKYEAWLVCLSIVCLPYFCHSPFLMFILSFAAFLCLLVPLLFIRSLV